MPARIAAIVAVLAALVAPALARAAAPPPAPQGLRAFLLRADEPARRVFPRTPSFAWQPVAGTTAYDFELARSRDFADGTILFHSSRLRAPAVAVPLALPWLTGEPDALYARVRSLTRTGTSQWSAPYGFNTSWDTLPRPLPAAAGLVRWTPVAGATRYEVWFPDAGKTFTTLTNVADERELYAFHQDAKWTGAVHWRVRAVRQVGAQPVGGIPAVAYGPWSATFTARNPALAHAPLRLGTTLAETASSPHRLTPGFTWSGSEDLQGRYQPLYRVYVFTDSRCVNVVFQGAIVGGPAYAPRLTGPLALPTTKDDMTKAATAYLPDGAEPQSFAADGAPVTSTEQPAATTAAPASTAASTAPAADSSSGALVDLWDSGWPSGRYYWTVVPVEPRVSAEDGSVEYRDVELPQDACAHGRRGSFGKASAPAVTAAGAAFASGLSPQGRLVAAAGSAPSFYGAPLVAWQPVLGALSYELEVSPTAYPWKPVRRTTTLATSALLQGLAPGTWFYRVRGVDPFVPGPAKQLVWSAPQRIRLAPPVFAVSR